MTATTLTTERVRSAWETETQFFTTKRILSREWDYGSGWTGLDGALFPLHRVSWLVDTGEVYAYRYAGDEARYLLLGTFPAGAAVLGTFPADTEAEAFEQRFTDWATRCMRRAPLTWWTYRLGTVIYVSVERAARAWAAQHDIGGSAGGWIYRRWQGEARHRPICQGWSAFTDVLIARGLIRSLGHGYVIRNGSL